MKGIPKLPPDSLPRIEGKGFAANIVLFPLITLVLVFLVLGILKILGEIGG